MLHSTTAYSDDAMMMDEMRDSYDSELERPFSKDSSSSDNDDEYRRAVRFLTKFHGRQVTDASMSANVLSSISEDDEFSAIDEGDDDDDEVMDMSSSSSSRDWSQGCGIGSLRKVPKQRSFMDLTALVVKEQDSSRATRNLIGKDCGGDSLDSA